MVASLAGVMSAPEHTQQRAHKAAEAFARQKEKAEAAKRTAGGKAARVSNLDSLAANRPKDASTLAAHEEHVAHMNHPVLKRRHEKNTDAKAEMQRIAQVSGSSRPHTIACH